MLVSPILAECFLTLQLLFKDLGLLGDVISFHYWELMTELGRFFKSCFTMSLRSRSEYLLPYWIFFIFTNLSSWKYKDSSLMLATLFFLEYLKSWTTHPRSLGTSRSNGIGGVISILAKFLYWSDSCWEINSFSSFLLSKVSYSFCLFMWSKADLLDLIRNLSYFPLVA